jgi:hypothetical protein
MADVSLLRRSYSWAVRNGVCYKDAVVMLGGDPPALAALDRVLAGALGLVTGGVSDVVLSVFDAQPRIVLLGRDMLVRLRDSLHGTTRAERSERLAAAHTIIVVTAFFEALKKAGTPILKIADQSGGRKDGARSGPFLDLLVRQPPPQPSPNLPVEHLLVELKTWYVNLSIRLDSLLTLSGRLTLEVLTENPQILDVVVDEAVSRYQDLYARLAVEVPEFRFWVSQSEHQATRAEVRRALAGVEALLAGLGTRNAGTGTAAALAAEYRVVLGRPILAEDDTPAGVRMPTLEEGYLDPDFRVRTVGGGLPASEDWWDREPVRRDLTEFLAGALTSPAMTAAPLVVLGQPGAGKSVLTKVLAARLPAAGFLPVRVALREVAAEAEIQDQVEQAIRAATGRRWEWPDVAAAAPGATPVVLLDGFDELLQATGVSQSDYLLKVARFQEREAAQGRPTVVLVTTRTAVADRARYPAGTVALRLEPFRDEQVARWLEMWNEGNAGRLRERGLAPLSPEVVARYGSLAGEPLLLMMLALYDADANALQRADGGQSLDETGLYEDLLKSFAEREVAKSGAGLPASELGARVEQEMQRLSLVAFSMVNRRRQWVTEEELDADLTALTGGRRGGAGGDMRLPLSPGGIAVGRFFFVQRAQAISADTRLQTFEFLHATFGEYLAARLTVQVAAGLPAQRPALAVGRAPADDDLLYALLSFGPLSAREMLRFVAGCCEREVAQADRARLADVLTGVLADARYRTGHRHAEYVPLPLPTSSRHGVYGANLVLLILSLVPAVTAGGLFPWAEDPPGEWHATVRLWRSALSELDWTDLALSLRLRRLWTETGRDLEISLAQGPVPGVEPADPYWLYQLGPRQVAGGREVWLRTYSDEVMHKMDIAGGANDSAVRHAVEPVVRWLGPALLTFTGIDGRAASAAHDLISLLILRAATCPDDELAAIYRRLGNGVAATTGGWAWAADPLRDTVLLILRCLREDAHRLPAAISAEVLAKTYYCSEIDNRQQARALLDAAIAALRALPERDTDEDAVHELAVAAVAAMTSLDPSLPSLPPHQMTSAVATLTGLDDWTGRDYVTFLVQATGGRLPLRHRLIDGYQPRSGAGGEAGAARV